MATLKRLPAEEGRLRVPHHEGIGTAVTQRHHELVGVDLYPRHTGKALVVGRDLWGWCLCKMVGREEGNQSGSLVPSVPGSGERCSTGRRRRGESIPAWFVVSAGVWMEARSTRVPPDTQTPAEAGVGRRLSLAACWSGLLAWLGGCRQRDTAMVRADRPEIAGWWLLQLGLTVLGWSFLRLRGNCPSCV